MIPLLENHLDQDLQQELSFPYSRRVTYCGDENSESLIVSQNLAFSKEKSSFPEWHLHDSMVVW
jgi:hypothetical protein